MRDVWSRLDTLLAEAISVYGRVLKIDSSKKLQGADANSANWGTNIGNKKVEQSWSSRTWPGEFRNYNWYNWVWTVEVQVGLYTFTKSIAVIFCLFHTRPHNPHLSIHLHSHLRTSQTRSMLHGPSRGGRDPDPKRRDKGRRDGGRLQSHTSAHNVETRRTWNKTNKCASGQRSPDLTNSGVCLNSYANGTFTFSTGQKSSQG